MHVTDRPHRLRPQRLLGVLLGVIGLTLVSGSVDTADARPHGHDHRPGAQQRVLDRVELPDGFLPEGIAIGREPVAYLGSRADGDIYAADLRTGQGRVISQGPGTPSVGVKIDKRGRLFVAGGSGGDGRVVDTRTGAVLASWKFTTAPSFVNDVLLTDTTAWFTDSQGAQLYGVELDNRRHGDRLPARFFTLALTGDWVQPPAGTNGANGLVESPDGRSLLVVNAGVLYRVDKWTGVATVVDLNGATLANGDGLLLKGRTLYAVQNRLNQIAVLEVNRRGTSATLQKVITSPDFDVPSTVASYGRSLFLPNARFTSPQIPTTTFWISRVNR